MQAAEEMMKEEMRNTKYDPTAGKKRGKKLLDRLLGVPPVLEKT